MNRLPPRRPPSVTFWLVAGLALLAFGLRWACIHQSLFGDELFLFSDVHGHSLGDVFSKVHDTEKTPPLYFVLGWLFARGSDADVLVRLPALVASVAAVPLAYLVGRRTVGRDAGLMAAAALALSSFQIFYGTEARGYSLVLALVLASTLALLIALERGGALAWALYAAASVAAIYTHYIAALVLVPQAAWALWAHRESARAQLIAAGAAVLAFLPWLPSFIVQVRHSGDEARRLSLIAPLNLSNAVKTEAQSLVGHPFVAPGKVPGLVTLLGLGAVILAAAVLFASERRLPRDPDRHLLLLALLAALPLLAIVVYSLRPHRSFLLPRNIVVAAPYALLLAGWLLTRPRPAIALPLCAAALAFVAVGSVKMLETGYQRPDGRAAAHYIDAHAPPDATVVDFPGPQGTQFYFRKPHTVVPYPKFDWARALRARTPVFVTYLSSGFLVGLGPPQQFASRFRLVAERTWRSVPAPLAVREFVAR